MNESSDEKEFSSVQFALGVFNMLSAVRMQNNQENNLVEICASFPTPRLKVFPGQISCCNLSHTLNLHSALMIEVDLVEEIRV